MLYTENNSELHMLVLKVSLVLFAKKYLNSKITLNLQAFEMFNLRIWTSGSNPFLLYGPLKVKQISTDL